MVRRRTLLVSALGLAGLAGAGASAAVLAEHGVIPGKGVVDAQLGHCAVPVPPPGAAAGPIVAGTFASARRNTTVDYAIAYPPGSGPGDQLPVCLVLHGYGTDGAHGLSAGNYPAYLAGYVNAGHPPFALAAPTGGGGYWHPHPGDDPLGMVLDEFLPLLAGRGLGADGVAVLGYSMGGYGALLAGLTAPGRFAAVVANAPAFWPSYDEAHRVNPGAFSSAAEWSRYGNLLGRADALSRLPMHIYIGASDSFEPIVRRLRGKLADPRTVRISKGCHDGTFWQAHAPEQMTIIGELLGR